MNSDSVTVASDIANAVIPLAAVFLGYWLKGFSIKGDYLGSRLDEISNELEQLLDAGSQYWREDTKGSRKPEEIALEAEIVGRLHSLNCLFEDLVPSFKEEKSNAAKAKISELRQSLTGSDFASNSGHSSSAYAISRAFIVSAELRVILQACLRNRR